MMKSFFKKLAFVMALAMVVTTAAPAAQASAAGEMGIALQGADSKSEVIASYEMKVGDEPVDFKYYGAPKDYLKQNPTWSSSAEAVATVDKYGVVTPVAAGTATITIALSNGMTGEIEVTVEDDNTYVYDQVSHKEATFTFNHDVAYVASDVTLVKVFAGGYEVNWPIETFKCEGNVVTIAPYVAFENGDEYIIKIGAEDAGTTFTTQLGEVDYIEVAWKSLDQNKAFAKLDEDDEDIEVTLSVKLFSKGVDVSAAPGYNLNDVEFELLNESDDYDLDENILVFEKYGKAATVKAVYTYEVNGEDVKKENIATIISEPAPKYTIVSVDKWTIAQRDNADVSIDWTGNLTHSIPAFDENNYSIVVLMTDSYGNKLVYPNEFADNSKKIGDVTVLALENVTDDGSDKFIEAAEAFEIRYTSTNQNKIFVGTETGDITTLGTSSSPVLVSLYDENSDGDVVLAKNLFAADIRVTDERKPSKIVAEVLVDELLVDVNNVVSKAYETGKVKFTVYDQYGDAVSGQSVNISESNDNINAGGATGNTNGDGVVEYTFDGSDFMYYNESKKKFVAVDSVKFAAKLNWPNDGVSTTFIVRTETPEVDKNGNLEIEDWELAASDIDVKVDKKVDGTLKTTEVTFYQTSNDLHVGIENKAILVTQGDKIPDTDVTYLKDGKKDFAIPSNKANVGDMYVVVYNPDGEALTETATTAALGIYQDAAGKYTVTAATETVTATGSAMEYLKTGTYTVKAYRVTKVYTDDNNVKTDRNARLEEFTTTFEVKNTSKTVSLKEQKYIDLPANDVNADNVEEVIFAAFDFNLGDGTLNEEAAFVVSYAAKYNEDSNYLFIYKVTIAVPLDNSDASVWYHAYDVPVNKAVKVGSDFNYEE